MNMHRSTANRSIYSNKHKHIEYIPGTLNVLLSVPHGGFLRPKHIPNRDYGTSVNGTPVFDHSQAKDPQLPVRIKGDRFTIELALSVAEVLYEKTGQYPHVVINRLHRRKLDCNCDREEATFGVPQAVQAWEAYHKFIEMAKGAMRGHGLFLDIHGHSHPEAWIELGYTVSAEKLNSGAMTAADTSVRRLYDRMVTSGNSVDIRELIAGPKSLGGLIAEIAPEFADLVVPSPAHPGPRGGEYYKGGYNVGRHGSKYGGPLDAIQIESPIDCRMPSKRKQYAAILGAAIATFLEIYYCDVSK